MSIAGQAEGKALETKRLVLMGAQCDILSIPQTLMQNLRAEKTCEIIKIHENIWTWLARQGLTCFFSVQEIAGGVNRSQQTGRQKFKPRFGIFLKKPRAGVMIKAVRKDVYILDHFI